MLTRIRKAVAATIHRDQAVFARARCIARFVSIVVLLAAAFSAASAWAAPTFALHYIEPIANTTWATSAMQGTLSDLDNDGDLDWTVGNAQSNPNFNWYEYQGPDTWVKHVISSGVSGVGEGAASLDVDGDGDRDLISGRHLFRNNGNGATWSRYTINTPAQGVPHDHQAADINGDGKIDLLSTCSYGKTTNPGIYWYESTSNPTQAWTAHFISVGVPAGYKGLHGATAPCATGDFNGDGRVDVAGALGWFENNGSSWTEHWNTSVFLGVNGTYQTAVRTQVIDLDGDNDLDVVQCECDTTTAVKIAWLENDGSGNFSRHVLREGFKEDYHSLAVADFDRDGDIDIFTAGGTLASGVTGHSLFLFENTAQTKANPNFVLRDFADTLSASDAAKIEQAFVYDHCHEPMMGDVDGDGDIDMIFKGWNGKTYGESPFQPAPFLYMENTTVVAPEPSTAALLGVGGLGLLAWRLRRRRAD